GPTGGRPWAGALPEPRSRMPADGLQRVREVVLGDVAAEDDAGDAREVVVQPRPKSSIDDLVSEVVGLVEVPHCVQVAWRPSGVEPVDVDVDLIPFEEGAEHLC